MEPVTEAEQKYADFIEQEGGADLRLISNIKSYILIGNKRHENIRKMIGGLYKTKEILIEKPKEEEIYKEIKRLFATRFGSDAGNVPDVIYKKLCSKYFTDEHDREQRSLVWALKEIKKIYPFSSSSYIESIERTILPLIVDMWDKQESTYEVTIDTRFDAFCRLGHYGVDQSACFNSSRERGQDKYRVYCLKDSFVVLLRHGDKVITRGWGFVYNNCVVLTNIYRRFDQKDAGLIYKAFVGCLNQTLKENGVEKEYTEAGSGQFGGGIGVYISSIYLNSEKRVFTDTLGKTNNTTSISIKDVITDSGPLKTSYMPARCWICKKIMVSSSRLWVDLKLTCSTCYPQGRYVCAATGNRLLNDKVDIYYNKHVSSKYLDNNANIVKCSITGQYAYLHDLIKIQNESGETSLAIPKEAQDAGYRLSSNGIYKR
jgi:hypothetical protein